jgi:hypothetical protein
VSATRSDAGRLAPETGDEISAAQAELDRALQIANLTNDPLRYVLSAMSAHQRAMHRLFVDGGLTLTQAISEAKQPPVLSPEGEKKFFAVAEQAIRGGAFQALDAVSRRLARSHDRRSIAIVCGVMFATAVAGFAIGWLWQARNIAELEATMDSVQNMALRDGQEDANQWFAVMSLNHWRDVAANCRFTVQDGRRRCDTWFWFDPAAPSAKPMKGASR